MSLVTIRDLSIGFRGPALLDNVSCEIADNQRIGLLGRNGAGKTTFMRMINGDVEPDAGAITFATGTTCSLLPQDVPHGLEGTIEEIVLTGYPAALGDEELWKAEQGVKRILSRMELDADTQFATLSSGMKRRVLLARALVAEPRMLLLDEPTNHLDVEAIEWLETFLLRFQGTLLFVTHDRVFLQKLATRILEIDRGRIFDWSCDYATFLKRKEQALAAEEKEHALFDKKLAQEERWIRQGIKARRTRNEGRVRALENMRRQHRDRQRAVGEVRLRIQQGQRSGNLVAGLEDVSFAYGERTILSGFSTTIMRGDRVGIIGPNGAGKTTLLRILLGQLPPQAGSVRMGTNLQVAYFDQLRAQLEEEKTVQENVGEGSDTVQVNGRGQHVIGYLQNFLFPPERSRTEVRFLSGGERNRVLLAKLFTKPANVLVLDEPTNDLDTETLELLENQLVEFTGTVLLVSHDRAFLNNVVTSTIAFDEGTVREYAGGYDDWLRQRPSKATPEPKASKSSGPAAKQMAAGAVREKQRLSYKEQRELAALPERIDELEAGIAALHQEMAKPSFYQQAGEEIARRQGLLKRLESELAQAFLRWEQLE